MQSESDIRLVIHVGGEETHAQTCSFSYVTAKEERSRNFHCPECRG